MLKVKLLEKTGRKGKVRSRFEDGPHPGLEEYVAGRQLVVEWGRRQEVLRDEERAARLAEHASTDSDLALGHAVSAVLESTGEPGAGADSDGLVMEEDELRRILYRAGIETAPADLHPVAYRDRRGSVHLPLVAAVSIAQAFAAAEPQTVVAYLDDRHEELRLRGNQPGERFWHDYLREKSPGYALARQWAGLDQEAEMLRQEIARLRILVGRAASELRAAGKSTELGL